ncbi:multidrug effflux MFS transporter [Roseibium salinum]|uniref:Bcr/CflA family efflux transporter n=1 Tax=Roseibium salinum TaxID=1604349 RepID=A0ABT3R7J4_9HYPH|nr:multidrug effflux MFS transporter [Roseibium sp. DSM 29163]MCX2725101.1 multidrug effflux MFS transporter [Roseibium sp. DSM 29163]
MNGDRSIMSARRTSLLGAGLVAIGPISMALYTPAMPALVEAFGTTDAAVKLTLTAYFAGFALTQLFCGPLTDAFGRKPVTQAFLTLYLVSSVLATFAPTVEFMVVARALQGVGAAVGIAVSRAIVRDQFTGQASAKIMNTIAMMLALGPAVSPTIGGVVLELFGWREVFWCMIIYGAALMTAVAVFQVETNPGPGMHHLNPRQLARNYGTLLRDPRFLAPSLLVGAGLGNLYALATVLPFILIYEVGLSPSAFGLTMIIQSGSFIAGTILTGRLLRIVDAQKLVPYGLALWVVAAALMCFSALTQEPSIFSVMGPVALFVFALALVLPASFTEAMAPFPYIAGAASSMLGFLQFGGGIVASLAIAALSDPVLGMAFILPGMPIAGIVCYLLLNRFGPRRPAPAE